MNTYIILFRGINVGGKNLLPMKEFTGFLKKFDYQDVSSYINSGNVVLKSKTDPVAQIKGIVLEHYGFSPEIFALNEMALSSAIENNPYAKYQGKCVHFYFCKKPIELNVEKVSKIISESETYHLDDNVFYLHAPDGIGRSKLAANIESCLQQVATGRNLNTVNKISVMIKS